MSTVKISDLTEITQIASDDYLPVLDTSDKSQGENGSTRSISFFNITQGSEVARLTGSNDDVQINALIDKIDERGGGSLFLKGKLADVLASIVPCTNLTMKGEKGYTVIKTGNNKNIHTISISGVNNVTIEDIEIDGNKANNQSQTGHLIRIDTADEILLEKLYVHDSGLHGIISNTAVTNLRIDKCTTKNNGVNANGSGVYLNGTTRAIISSLISTGNQLDGLQWKTSDKIIASKIISYSNGRCGIYAIDGHADMSNINLYSNSSIGLSIENSSGFNTTVNAAVGEIYNNGNDGIRITSSDHCGLNNLRVYNNATAFTGAGLHLRATNVGETCNRHRILNCAFFDTQGASATQEYGILANGAGSIDRNIVSANEIYGNKTAQFQQDTWGANNVYSAANNVLS